MSDKSDQMRPIPDGGLKEAMPSWLKRPPAWRELPSAQERHERSLPEPDTSVIDPHSLVDVTDLPQWLQSISARGVIPAPEADVIPNKEESTTEEAATITTETEIPTAANEASEVSTSEEVTPVADDVTTLSKSAPASPSELASTGMPAWLMPVALFAILIIVVVLFYVL